MNNQSDKESSYRRLYRSRQNKVLGGVCGGLSEYFNWSLTTIRIIWLILSLFWGIGLLVYVAAWFIIPFKPETESNTISSRPGIGQIFGLVLITLGLIGFYRTFGGHSVLFWLPIKNYIMPISLVVLGILMLFVKPIRHIKSASDRSIEEKNDFSINNSEYPRSKGDRFNRDRKDRMIFGICSGIARNFNLDPVLIRLLWLAGTFITDGLGIIVYLLIAIIVPYATE